MAGTVRTFDELMPDELPLAGGKGSSLARLYQAGYPVPGGFVILPAAFAQGTLAPEAWAQAALTIGKTPQPSSLLAPRSPIQLAG